MQKFVPVSRFNLAPQVSFYPFIKKKEGVWSSNYLREHANIYYVISYEKLVDMLSKSLLVFIFT